jgi:Ca2+-binding RTX toxin-like protein
MSDEQAFQIRVTDTADTSTLQVKFISEKAGYKNTLGWYNTQTLTGGILFGAIEADGRRATVKPGVTTASFVVDTAAVASIAFFLIPDGGGLSQNTASELGRPVKLVQLANGSWAVATVGADGNVELDASGNPNVLVGRNANAIFTDTSKNAGDVDYGSSKVGSQQTAATLAGDTADGPAGLLAWEDTAATRRPDGTFSKPGDADYNDAVFDVREFKGQTITGTDLGETLTGGIANDVIYGMGGNDKLNGDKGDDKLDGGPGADRMAGGPGNDTYVVDDTGDAVVESSNAGTDTVLTTLASLTLPSNVENLVYTGTGAFSGTGNSLPNALTGGPDVDTLSGLGGSDRIEGRGGSDWMSGGFSADTFVFKAIDSNAADVDTISGFVVGQDQLELTGLAIAQLAQSDVNQDSVLDTALTLSNNAHVHLLGVQGVTNWDTLL